MGKKILSLSYKHADNIDLMTKKGYDTTANAKWLTAFYNHYHSENETLAGGF